MKFYREKTMQNCAVMISIGGFLLHAMLDVNFQIPASMAIFCTLTIIAADDEKTGDRRSEKIAFYISCILILLAAFGYSYRLTAGEKAFDSFKTMIHQSLRENKFTTAQIIQKYNEVEKYRPYSSFHVMDLYHYYYAKRMYREALYYLDLGIQRSPERAGNYYTKAVYMLTVGELEKAEESIRKSELYHSSDFLISFLYIRSTNHGSVEALSASSGLNHCTPEFSSSHILSASVSSAAVSAVPLPCPPPPS